MQEGGLYKKFVMWTLTGFSCWSFTGELVLQLLNFCKSAVRTCFDLFVFLEVMERWLLYCVQVLLNSMYLRAVTSSAMNLPTTSSSSAQSFHEHLLVYDLSAFTFNLNASYSGDSHGEWCFRISSSISLFRWVMQCHTSPSVLTGHWICNLQQLDLCFQNWYDGLLGWTQEFSLSSEIKELNWFTRLDGFIVEFDLSTW